MRGWRKTHPPSEEERRKSACRAYTRMLIKRGKIIPGPCCYCGIKPAHAHHPDYGNPRLVIWMCADHHRRHHWRLSHLTEAVIQAL